MHVEEHKVHYPLAADAVQNNCYMDDLIPSTPTVEVAKETQRKLTELGNKAAFHIQKCISNCLEVLEYILAVDRASQIDQEKNAFPTTKMLGVNVLKKTATIYDPLRFLSPYIVGAKLLVQPSSQADGPASAALA